MIPDYQSIMLQLLKFAKDGKEHSFRDAINYISDFFRLTDEERRIKLPSGYDIIINNRVGWARTYLKKAGLLEDPRRGFFKMTNRGIEVLMKDPPIIDVKFLMQFPEFVEFQSPKKKDTAHEMGILLDLKRETKTPQELIEEGSTNLKENLANELLEKLRTNSSGFFEGVVVDLIVKMGYGEGEVTGGSGDGGIDGIIYQDKLGLEKIYLQAKRYAETKLINPTIIKNFIGTLDVKKANKGIFITASSFVGDIEEIVKGTSKNIILIDGEKLVELMIEYNVGVEIDKSYDIKKIDLDYFEE